MTALRELLWESAVGTVPPLEISGLDYDSRRIQPGFAFFAFPGENVDGHDFVPQARAAGASVVVSGRPRPGGDPGEWVQVKHGRRALAQAARGFYEAPDETIKLIGITGTNGKTTTAFLIDELLRSAGLKTGRFGTINYRLGDQLEEAVNTTPESLDLVRLLSRLREMSADYAVLEASSHALELGRIYGLRFEAAIFTNLTQDHLDFHGTMERYGAAKGRLFEGAGGPAPRFSILNLDDPWGRRYQQFPAEETVTYALRRKADLTAKDIESDFDGLRFRIVGRGLDLPIRSRLLGRFNVYNLLAAAACGSALGLDAKALRRGLEAAETAPGRFETVRAGQSFLVAVDYAHTDDALRNLIRAAKRIAPRGGKVLTVFGCGGDRDRAKRPLMGAAAGELSDRVILTSDNPRMEDPLRILADAEVGLQRVEANYLREPDRRSAIRKALLEAGPNDVVLIAGKGHETYQQVGKEKLPFDDRQTARELLQELLGRRRAG